MRSYKQLCGIAAALERVGERWTLLLIRDLLPGPLRFGELQALEAGLAPNLLSTRLRDLTARGLVHKTEDGRYALTDEGRLLQPVLFALGDFGTRHLTPTDDTRFDARWLLLSLTRLSQNSGLAGTLEIRLPPATYTLALDAAGDTRLHAGPAPAPDLVLTGGAQAFLGLFQGQTPEALIDRGALHALGDRDLLERWAGALRERFSATLTAPKTKTAGP